MTEPVLNYRVAYADTDQMGVVYYGNYLQLFERARTEWIRQQGMTYRELEENGIALPVIQAHVNYHAPAKYDEVIQLYASLGEIRGARITIHCQVKRQQTLLADGYTTLAFVDRNTARPIRPPQDIIRILTENHSNNQP